MQFAMLRKISPVLLAIDFVIVAILAIGFTYLINPSEQSIPSYFLDRLDVTSTQPNEILANYPQMKVADFQNVTANGGKYIVQSNNITFVPDRNKRNQEDADIVNEAGAATLLKNLNKRLNLPTQSHSDIDRLLLTLDEPEPIKVTKAQTIRGKYTCVPPKANAKVEEGCVEGVQTSSTVYYALDLAPLENPVMLMTGDQITVQGELVPVETLSSDRWQKYPIKGIFRAATIDKAE